MLSLSQLFGRLMLRRKLILAFTAMALITALSGAVSLYLVSSIGGAFSVFADVTAPLAKHSRQLKVDVEAMGKLVMRAVNERRPIDRIDEQLSALNDSSNAHIREIRRLANEAGATVDFDGAAQRQTEYVATLRQILQNDARGRAAASTTAQRQSAFDGLLRDAVAALTAIADRTDGLLSEAEEQVKVQEQTGSNTTDSLSGMLSTFMTEIYPAQRYSSKLVTELVRLADIGRRLARVDSAELAAARNEAEASLQRVARIIAQLDGRLQDRGGQRNFLRVKEPFERVADSVRSPDGLFASQSETLEARRQISIGRGRLDQIAEAYSSVLAEVEAHADERNQTAREQAQSGIIHARNVVAGAALLAVLGALSFAFFFSRRISAPLIRLADHAGTIRASGDLLPLPDQSVNTRHDEIGGLARSFNALIVELSEARSRLIEWSEGEIRLQYDRLNAAINNMPVGLCMFDAEQKLIICNARYAEIYHLTPEMTQAGTPLRTILAYRLNSNIYSGEVDSLETRLAAIASGKAWYNVSELTDSRVIAVSHHPLPDGGSIATHEDITERRKSEQKIAYMAHHDALTELPNRIRFRENLATALNTVDESAPVAVLCLDLDHFKAVNDTLGHPIGDALLRIVARRLESCVREGDTAARLGGDEFAIIQAGSDQPAGSIALADRAIAELTKPYEVEGHQVVIGASIGITLSPLDGKDPDQLLKKADMALYRAKQQGRGIYSFFAPGMDEEMQKRRELELDLRKAVVLKQFELYYQPAVNVESGDITGFEALLRWIHPERGIIPPNDFIPLAEEIGLINPIGNWVLRQACQDAMSWPDNVTVAVNVSPVQFQSQTLVLDVIAALGASGLPARRLEIEITEAVLLNDTNATVATLNQLRDLGVRIAMDDFGTGYSSLGYLQKFPFDKIKIDRSFIHNLGEKADSRAIVRAVAGLGVTLGITTTAEGVETEEEMRQLRREGCTEVQGYLFSKPRPIAEVAGILRRFDERGKSVA